MKYAYKIFDLYVDEEGVAHPMTLFHGFYGSRKLRVGIWLNAENKLVLDGSGQERYVSGFHAYPTMDDVRAWFTGVANRKNRVIVRVKVDKCRWKPRAVRDTILANRMIIPKADWEQRITAEDLE